jgi:hypothetical protein
LSRSLSDEIRRDHRYSFPDLLGALDDDTIPWMKAFFDRPKVARAFPDPYRLDMNFVVGFNHRHLEVAL